MNDLSQMLNANELENILQNRRSLRRLEAASAAQDNDGDFVKIGPIDLSVAPTNPIQLPSPFKAIWMQQATDAGVEVSFIRGALNSNSRDNAVPLSLNLSIAFDDFVGLSYLNWTAQAGKTMTLYLALKAEFRIGKIVSVSSGGISVSTGSSVSTPALSTVTSAAAILLAQNTSRLNATIQNNGAVDIFLGGSTVTALTGIKLAIGESMEWKNTAALYAIASTTSNTAIATMGET